MAEVDIAPHFGAELRDYFKPTNTWIANGIAFLDDVQQFYRERSVIEKEYSAKLAALAKKYFEKKARKSSNLSVGDTPTMTPGSLESASLTTWTTQITTLENRAAEHDRYGNELISALADPLRALATRYDELRKRHAEYADRLEKERDACYGDLRKTKGKYDAVCQEVENKRKKAESSFDYSKAKAQSAYQQQILDMNNVKNTYLIAINVTNKQKEKYYYEYVPDILDSLQDLSESRVVKLNSVWSQAARLETDMLQRSQEYTKYLEQEITRNVPSLDSMMFIRHNTGAWQEPAGYVFEASPVWHDDDRMVVDEPAKIFLRNVLGKSKAQLGDLRRGVDQKKRDIDAAQKIKYLVREGKDKRDEVEVVRAIFAMSEELHQLDYKRTTAEVETFSITAAVGDVTLGAKSHNFRSQTFKIPTNCDLCGDRIWGLSAKGFDCRDCGYTCHSKCEMKVPAECPGELSKEDKKKLKIERQDSANTLLSPTSNPNPATSTTELPNLSRSNTMNSLSSGYAASANRSITGNGPKTPTEETAPAPRKNRVMAPPPTAYISELPADGGANGAAAVQRGKMLYGFEGNGDGELSVAEGREFVLVEPDDGSGWIRVRVGYKEGLVPASYIELSAPEPAELSGASAAAELNAEGARPASSYSNSGSSVAGSVTAPKRRGPAVAPRKGARKLRYVEALYDYTAATDTEHSMAEGERLVLIKDDPGDGWVEVEKGGVAKSVPASYVQAA